MTQRRRSGARRAAAARGPRGRTVVRGTVIVVAAGGAAALALSTGFPVDRIEVRGVSKAQASTLGGVAKRSIGGDGLLRVDADAVRTRLESLPTVRAASVDRAFPRTLAITVEPEVPAAVVPLGSARYVISATGRVIGPASRTTQLPFLAAAPADVPPPGGHVRAPGVLSELAVVRALPSRYAVRLAGVQLADGQLTARARAGFDIHLGDDGELGRKLRIAAAALRAAGGADVGQIAYLDVTAPDRPAVRTVVPNPQTLESSGPIQLDLGDGANAAPVGDTADGSTAAQAPSSDPSELVLDLFGGSAA